MTLPESHHLSVTAKAVPVSDSSWSGAQPTLIPACPFLEPWASSSQHPGREARELGLNLFKSLTETPSGWVDSP